MNPFSALGVSEVGEWIIAVGALGTAAFGIVDASKSAWGGISRRGLGFIAAALAPFEPALTSALGKGCDWRSLVRAHWINGRPKDEQKSIAVSLIQLGLTPETAPAVAAHGQVAPEALQEVVVALTHGRELSPEELNVLGRFRATIEARIDAAYERADQAYRNTARTAAGVVAVLLALAATYVAGSDDYLMALLVGLVATPLAPIARDVASSLSTAARALRHRATG